MNRIAYIVLSLSLLSLSGCGRGGEYSAPEPAPAAEIDPPSGLLIDSGEIRVSHRHLSPEEVVLEAQPGEDATRAIKQDMTLFDDREKPSNKSIEGTGE